MSDRSALTEWFHALASKSRDELERVASPASLDKLRAHIAWSLPDCLPLDDLNEGRFADLVLSRALFARDAIGPRRTALEPENNPSASPETQNVSP